MFKTIVENNYLAVRVANVFVRERLATRIYEGSLKRCSPEFVAEVYRAKNKHFPYYGLVFAAMTNLGFLSRWNR
jgi:hypothetical protein